jgi:hypothetical protein
MTSKYRLEMKQWLNDLRADFGDYAPKETLNSLYSALSDKSLSDGAIDKMSAYLETATKENYKMRNGKAAKKEMLYLVPSIAGDIIYFHDRVSGTTPVIMHRQPNGLFSYYGEKEWITRLGGRGEFSQIFKMLEDGDYFHDKK